jgi:metal-sulfur cluster biosynthetic enzyme
MVQLKNVQLYNIYYVIPSLGMIYCKFYLEVLLTKTFG